MFRLSKEEKANLTDEQHQQIDTNQKVGMRGQEVGIYLLMEQEGDQLHYVHYNTGQKPSDPTGHVHLLEEFELNSKEEEKKLYAVTPIYGKFGVGESG